MSTANNQPKGFSENFGISPLVWRRLGAGAGRGLKGLPAAPSLSLLEVTARIITEHSHADLSQTATGVVTAALLVSFAVCFDWFQHERPRMFLSCPSEPP